MSFHHIPVMAAELQQYLQLQPGMTVLDATIGGGGHAQMAAEIVGRTGMVIGVDRDPVAITAAQERLAAAGITWVQCVVDHYQNVASNPAIAPHLPVDAIICDLGVSSPQLDQPERGFTFQNPQQLDMRFNQQDQKVTAQDIVDHWSQTDLVALLTAGDEPLAFPIAKRIVALRTDYETIPPDVLVNTVSTVYRQRWRKPSRLHPATRTWQALRMAVNQELEGLRQALPVLLAVLRPGGRMAVISFHSGEDAIVKNFFRDQAKECVCPPELPICRCNHPPSLRVITTKPLVPSDEEVIANPRSRSAKLRLAQKI